MKIKILTTGKALLPMRATKYSSGFDILAEREPEIIGTQFSTSTWKSIDYIQYRTGIQISPDSKSLHTLIHPRSSISKYNLVLANSIGLIDNDYRGEILLRFKYIFQPEDVLFLDPDKYPAFVIQVNQPKIYQMGDKIGQLVFETGTHDIKFERVNSLDNTERGDGGFGHTDAK